MSQKQGNSSRTSKSRPGKSSGQLTNLDDLDGELEAALAQALAATEARLPDAAATRGGAAPEDTEGTLNFVIDEAAESQALDDLFDDDGGVDLDDLFGDELDEELDRILDSVNDLEAPRGLRSGPDAAALDHFEGDDDEEEESRIEIDDETIDEDDEVEVVDDDLDAQMEKLLSGSFSGSGGLSDDDPDLAFPTAFEDEGDDEILAAGDEGIVPIADERELQLARLQSQVAELARLLSVRDLELRSAEDRLEGLQAQVVSATRQSAAVKREFDSYRRRVERDKEETKKFAGEKVLKEFLGVIDNLERALDHSGAARSTPLGQGVEMTLGQFLAALRRCGAMQVQSRPHTEFDPTVHEAVGQEYSEDVAAGHIVASMQNGFTLHGRLLRAAMVSVSRGPRDADGSATVGDAPSDAETLDATAPVAGAAGEPGSEGASESACGGPNAGQGSGAGGEAVAADEATEADSADAAETVADAPLTEDLDDGEEGADAEAKPKKRRPSRRKKAPKAEAEKRTSEQDPRGDGDEGVPPDAEPEADEADE